MSALADVGAGEALERLARREASSVELTRELLERIDALDDELGAFVRINPRAEAEANWIQANQPEVWAATGQGEAQGKAPEELLERLIEQTEPGSMGLMLQPYWSPGIKRPGRSTSSAW